MEPAELSMHPLFLIKKIKCHLEWKRKLPRADKLLRTPSSNRTKELLVMNKDKRRIDIGLLTKLICTNSDLLSKRFADYAGQKVRTVYLFYMWLSRINLQKKKYRSWNCMFFELKNLIEKKMSSLISLVRNIGLTWNQFKFKNKHGVRGVALNPSDIRNWFKPHSLLLVKISKPTYCFFSPPKRTRQINPFKLTDVLSRNRGNVEVI